jgi:hypothetical protein
MKLIIFALNLFFLIVILTPAYFQLRKAYELRKLYRESKKFLELTTKINDFLAKGDNKIKYQKELIEYLSLLGNQFQSDNPMDYNKLYSIFKDIIPDFKQVEREKKLKKLLEV